MPLLTTDVGNSCTVSNHCSSHNTTTRVLLLERLVDACPAGDSVQLLQVPRAGGPPAPLHRGGRGGQEE